MRFYRNVKFQLNSSCHIKSQILKFLFKSYGPKKTLVFCISFLHFDDFLTIFSKDLMKIFDFFKKMKKRILAADFDKCIKEKNLNSPNLSNNVRRTLILKDYDIASYPCSNYGP